MFAKSSNYLVSLIVAIASFGAFTQSVLAIDWTTAPDGIWAYNCDFNGGDIGSARVPGSQCSKTCASKSGCTHYAHTSYNGGTCWMKGGGASKESAIRNSLAYSVCGILGQKQDRPMTCSKEKKIQIYKFCINGDDDGAGAYGEHSLRLDGQVYYPSSGFKDFREGQCHDLRDTPWREVGTWKTLDVGTEEHDSTSENDSTFAHVAGKDWYVDTCHPYEVKLSRDFKSQRNYKVCFDLGVEIGNDIGSGSAGVTSCTEWSDPAESYIWLMRVEPVRSSRRLLRHETVMDVNEPMVK